MKKDIVVLGLGNPLMSDEGIGGFLINKLLERECEFPDVDFIDAGTGGMAVLHLIAHRKKAVIMDCAYMNSAPGTITRFEPNDVKTQKKLAHYSLHEADILKIIDLSRELKQYPHQIVIFGIEPQFVKPGQQLSQILADRIDNYIAAILEELSL